MTTVRAFSLQTPHRISHQAFKVSGAWWKRDNAEVMVQARVDRAHGQWAASWQPSRPRKQPPASKPPKPTPHF